jgi:hypothetical protein
MVFSAELNSVNVHTTIVGPVVCQSNEEFNIGLLSSRDYFVEGCEVDLGLAIVPPLQNVWTGTSAFTTVLWETTGDCCAISIIEAPSTHHIQSSFLGSREAFLDIGSKLSHVSPGDLFILGCLTSLKGK